MRKRWEKGNQRIVLGKNAKKQKSEVINRCRCTKEYLNNNGWQEWLVDLQFNS